MTNLPAMGEREREAYDRGYSAATRDSQPKNWQLELNPLAGPQLWYTDGAGVYRLDTPKELPWSQLGRRELVIMQALVKESLARIEERLA